MDDITERLRTIIATPHGVDIWTTTALEAADEIKRLREQVQYRDDVIAMLRADVARLGSFLHPIGEQARRD